MFSRVLNGASSAANCARKIAGPLIVCISANSRNLPEHLIMFSPSVPKFSCRSHGLVLVGIADMAGKKGPPCGVEANRVAAYTSPHRLGGSASGLCPHVLGCPL